MEKLTLIATLISKLFKNELTSEEQKILEDWANERPENKAYLDKLTAPGAVIEDIRLFSELEKDEEEWTSKLTQRVLGSTLPNRKSLKRLAPWWAAVAAILLFLVGGVIIFVHSDRKSLDTDQPLVMESDVPWDPEKPTLSINGERTISLDDLSGDNIGSHTGINISKTADQLVYTDNGQIGQQKIDYHTLTTPIGCKYTVRLDDGTTVTLNAQSSVTFPTHFKRGEPRKIHITGEAFLSVATQLDEQGHKIPFLVNVDDKQTISVKGTEFNVNSYVSSRVTTTLFEGLVKIHAIGTDKNKEATLLPGRQMELTKDGQLVENIQPDLLSVASWRENVFQFHSATIVSIMDELERWYGISVKYKDIPDSRFNIFGLRRESNLSEILRELTLTGEVAFVVSDSKENGGKQVVEVRKYNQP